MKFSLRLLYLYLFSFVGLIVTIIGTIQILDLTLKTYVFKVDDVSYPVMPITSEKGEILVSKEDQQRQQETENANQKKRQMSNSMAMILVGVPVYLYHWKTIRKEAKS